MRKGYTMFQQKIDGLDSALSYVRKRANYPYLKENLAQLASIDTEVLISYELINKHSHTNKELNHIMCALLLIKQALDIHESVTEGNLTSEKMRKQRQLTVLAGDFYSGLYYRELAMLEKPQLIEIFAEAIAGINQARANSYQALQAGKFKIENLILAESYIHQHLARYFGESTEYINVIKTAMTLARLKGNKNNVIDVKIEAKNLWIQFLETELTKQLNKIKNGELSDRLKNHLTALIQPKHEGELIIL